MDYKSRDFEKVLSGYDVAVNSLGADTLEKSLDVLKRGGKLIPISGPPDPDFARAQGLNFVLRIVLRLMSASIRRKARARGVDFSFFFFRAHGGHIPQTPPVNDTVLSGEWH